MIIYFSRPQAAAPAALGLWFQWVEKTNIVSKFTAPNSALLLLMWCFIYLLSPLEPSPQHDIRHQAWAQISQQAVTDDTHTHTLTLSQTYIAFHKFFHTQLPARPRHTATPAMFYACNEEAFLHRKECNFHVKIKFSMRFVIKFQLNLNDFA